MQKNYWIIFILLLSATSIAQEWSLKLKSAVELRTFKLTNKIDVDDTKLAGATISLYKGSSLVTQMQSDGNGDFVIDVPANGDYILSVSYSGCNTKKFAISTIGVPPEIAKDNYKPTFGIEGVIMAKAFPTIDYSILKQPLARIVYTSNGKKFDDEQSYTNQMLTELSRIRDAENVLMNNFTSTNNTGDVALSKGDCPLAKASYEKAMTIINGEPYPSQQLPKVGDCLKAKELADKKALDEANTKSNEAKLAAEKAEADRLAKEASTKAKAESEKTEAKKREDEKIAKQKAEAEKLQADKLSKEKKEKEKVTVEKKQSEPLKQEPPTKEKTISPAKEQNTGLTPNNSGSGSGSSGVNTGDAKYSIPQALGSDKYKATIKRADELFKMKRYTEAKPMYEEALKQKANDPYATNKLAEIEKLSLKK